MAARRPKPALVGRTSARRIPVFIGRGLAGGLGTLIAPGEAGSLLALVSDRHVDRLYGRMAAAALRHAGWKVVKIVLPPGESIKSAATIRRLHERWFASGLDRCSPVVAFGGGTVTDGAGYAAATFMRGLPLWMVPTTVIGQVDAAIGGKVGINHKRGKNLIGSFYQPAGIVIDPDFLASLPVRELRSGLAEVVKYGVIADPAVFRSCERRLADWMTGESAIDTGLITRCIRSKIGVVAKDETDQGLRHILNFGHTLGHAFERWGGFRRLRHGEAVVLGMVGATFVASRRNLISVRAAGRILALCRIIRPRRRLPRFTAQELLPHLRVDKKRRAGRNRYVLPLDIGKAGIIDDISAGEIRSAIAGISGWLATSSVSGKGDAK